MKPPFNGGASRRIGWSASAIAAAVFLLGASPAPQNASQPLEYPQTRKVEHVDMYHGVKVPDPYRWLEDDNSPDTARWVEAQNKVTFGYLEKIPYRAPLKARLEALFNYPKYGAPSRKGDNFFFSKNDGLQNQSVLYIQKGLTGTPEALIDPNKWSEDGTVRLAAFELSRDGKYAVVGVSRSGSDWQEFGVMEMATRKMLADKLEWVKVSGASWRGNGFFYSRYPAPAKGHELSSANENHQVYFHRVGTPQSADELVFQDPANPQRFHMVGTTDDERFAILVVSDQGKGKKGNAVFVRDLSKNETTFSPLIGSIGDDSFDVIDNVGDKLLVQTDRGAPNGRVVLIDPKQPAELNWKTVLAERTEPLQSATTAGGKLFVTYLKDVATVASVHSLDGTLENTVALPGPGSAGGFGGERDDTFVFYTFTSFSVPPTIYRYDIATRTSSVFRTPEIPGFDATAFESKQVFYASKDGTRVPMFLVYRKGLKQDGTNPVLLSGYGGFNITTAPSFSALRIALLEQGFIYASANMRGGGEYGEKWHEAGTKLKKQNVFDDFIAAAEWLISNKYTSSSRLAIQGGSNGGLLIGAVINQRPELFRVAIPQVGVMDMLRFHKFTIGWNWIADYGSSDNAAEFPALFAYSPLHNIKQGAKYPATLITTADHDDRVVPAHSFKYAATLQERASRETPVLIRIETKSGHGAVNTTKQIESIADIYAFIFHNMNITPTFGAIAAPTNAGQSPSRPSDQPRKNYEAISLFGAKLTAPSADPIAQASYDQARRDFDSTPTEDHYIWLGRRTAYLGRYREAIGIYTEGLTKFPDSYRLYRHRGHRHISIRQFGRAIADFEKAAALVQGKPLEVEPDGAPNKAGIPVSNTQFNIYYHLGLSYFLTRDFAKAEAAYRECLKWSKNDDSVVATTDWLYMTLRRTGQAAAAAAALAPIRRDLTILENGAYLDRLLMFKGVIAEEDFARSKPDENVSEKAVRAYGMGLVHLWRGDKTRARALFDELATSGSWASFATIAAEVELADLVRAEPDRSSVASTMRAWTLSWNTYDLDLAGRLFTAQTPPTYFSSEKPGRIQGFDALLDHHKSFGFVPGGKLADNRLWLEDVTVQEDGKTSYVTAFWFFDRDVAATGPVQRGPVTFVLIRTADGWRIAHAHFANDPPRSAQPDGLHELASNDVRHAAPGWLGTHLFLSAQGRGERTACGRDDAPVAAGAAVPDHEHRVDPRANRSMCGIGASLSPR